MWLTRWKYSDLADPEDLDETATNSTYVGYMSFKKQLMKKVIIYRHFTALVKFNWNGFMSGVGRDLLISTGL